MSARRYFWLLLCAYLLLVGTFPGILLVGVMLLNLSGCTNPACWYALFPFLLVLPALPYVFSAVASLISLYRCSETGLSRAWVIPAFTLPLGIGELFDPNLLNVLSMLGRWFENGAVVRLLFVLVEWALPVLVLFFIGRYERPIEQDRSIRIAHVVAWTSFVWLLPMLITRMLPPSWSLALRPYLEGLLNFLYPAVLPIGYRQLPPLLLMMAALLYLLTKSSLVNAAYWQRLQRR